MIKKILQTAFLIASIGLLWAIPAQTHAADCQFGAGDIREEFKNCNPSIGVKPDSNVDLQVTDSGSDFRTITATVIRRVQIITSVLAIGIIVWIGLILVLPVSAEAKESAKSKVISVSLGFLVMIAATIIVNGLINILYDVFQ
mgnify:CR=1 FL=1